MSSDRTATASRRAEPLAVWHARQMNNPASQFLAACDAAGVLPGLREAARWRRGEGEAIFAAWKLWPRSKTLPPHRSSPPPRVAAHPLVPTPRGAAVNRRGHRPSWLPAGWRMRESAGWWTVTDSMGHVRAAVRLDGGIIPVNAAPTGAPLEGGTA